MPFGKSKPASSGSRCSHNWRELSRTEVWRGKKQYATIRYECTRCFAHDTRTEQIAGF